MKPTVVKRHVEVLELRKFILCTEPVKYQSVNVGCKSKRHEIIKKRFENT